MSPVADAAAVSDDRLILALDEGTTSTRAIAFGRDGRPVASAQRAFEQRYPSPGHVTHDPEAIWESQLNIAREVIAAVGGPERIAAIGITNQRETTLVWDRATGAAVADAIVWQRRITAPACEALRARGLEPLFRERTGLPPDAYFSGPKIAHILDARAGLRRRAERGELAFGTVDTFLAWRLTGGRAHVTDVSNASRTLLFDIHRLRWDPDLLGLVGVPAAVLPTVVPTSGLIGETDASIFGRSIPIAALAGDQQAATFGQACFEPGDAKTTYGTGAFLLLNTGSEAVASKNRLLTTIGWQLEPGGPVTYALEGSVFVAGAAIQWLRDGLQAGRDFGGHRRAGGERARHRRPGGGSRLHRPRRAVLGPRRSGRDPRHHPGHGAGSHCPGHARGDRRPGGGRRPGDGSGQGTAFEGTPRRRRCGQER